MPIPATHGTRRLERADERETPVEQLIGLVSQRAGIDEGSAKTAVETVLGFLKDKLPEQIASRVEKVASGGDIDPSSMLGGLFGRQAARPRPAMQPPYQPCGAGPV
jgi:hypothetical protein